MSRAREEAERRRENNRSYPYEELITYDMEVDAFVLGAKWQSGQPIEISDEMVERGVRGAHRAIIPDMMILFPNVFGSQERYEEFLYAVTRGVLEAALQAPRVDVCLECGAIGSDALRHDKWHSTREEEQ